MNRYRITDLTTGQSVTLYAGNRYEAVHTAGMDDTPCRIEIWVFENGEGHWGTLGHHALERQSHE